MLNRSRSSFVIAALTVLLLLIPALDTAFGGDVDRISAQELKARLGDPNLLIVDVRVELGWSKSTSKIPGAVKEDPMDVGSWARKYPRNKTVVLYCA